MYIRKFEADSLDEALKTIKTELGPDAIILKTVTNKGLKGAFKKNKIEITAAISEKNYTKKSKVDLALGDQNKDRFYQNNSSYISNMIDDYDQGQGNHARHEVKNPGNAGGGYGNVALNKQVKQVKDIGSKIKNSLDDFLSSGVGEMNEDRYVSQSATSTAPAASAQPAIQAAPQVEEPALDFAPVNNTETTVSSEQLQVIEKQQLKIEELERKLFELSRNVQKLDKKEPAGIYHLRSTLKSLNINDEYIAKISKKAIFELSDEEVESSDAVFEFALREMMTNFATAMPQFSTIDSEEEQVVTILLSEGGSGQTSMMYKLGALKKDSVLIRCGETNANSFTEKVFGLNVVNASTIPEIISEIRKATEQGLSVFVDYKANTNELNETKKFIDGVRRSFGKVEVLVSLCAIHSEIYNKKVLNQYGKLANGMVISSLDLCLNYGAIFNLSYEYENLPMMFFGTGTMVPDDLEAASAERVLAGIFQIV